MTLQDELKMPVFIDAFQEAYINIVFTANWLEDKMQKELKHFHLTIPQYNVLRILRGQKGNPISALDIQKRMIHRSSNVTRILEKLAEKDLINRKYCEDNRRKMDITISDNGIELLKKTDHLVLKSYNRIRVALKEKEAKLLNEQLNQIRAIFDKND